jgi:hypothetical protein
MIESFYDGGLEKRGKKPETLDITHWIVEGNVATSDIVGKTFRGGIATTAIDSDDGMHLVLIGGGTAQDGFSFRHLIISSGGVGEISGKACRWLFASGIGLVCATYSSESDTTMAAKWFSGDNQKGLRIVVMRSDGQVADQFIVGDAQCESMLTDGFFVAADDSAHIVYSCLTRNGDTTTSSKRYSSFSLGLASFSAGGLSVGNTSATPRHVEATSVKIIGFPSWVTYDPRSRIALVAGYCEAQEVHSGMAGRTSQYCGSRYALRDVGVKIFSLEDQTVAMMASPRSPDGIDTQIHYLQYRDGAWSAPLVVAVESVFSTGFFALGHRNGRAFLVTREGATIGRWIKY